MYATWEETFVPAQDLCVILMEDKSFYRAANALLHKSSMVGIARSQDLMFFLYQRYSVRFHSHVDRRKCRKNS